MSRLTHDTISGVFPPMLTPFTESGEVDYDSFVTNLHFWNDAELSGYLVLGSNSETAYLTEEEKLQLTALTKEHAKKGRIILAGTGLESTRDTVRFTRLAAMKGADAALVLTPFYYSELMNDAVLINHFTRIADNSDIPILIYNVTKFTHVNISVNAVHILSQHPNIIGMKDSSGNVAQLEQFKSAAGNNYAVVNGTAAVWYPALTIGIRAGILALANCTPNECSLIQKYYCDGELEKSRALYEQLLPLNKAITFQFGVPGLKYAATLLGYKGGYPRSPLLPLGEADRKMINSIISSAGLR
jgi:4-hydroxy-2-oxoglutarate aldolase